MKKGVQDRVTVASNCGIAFDNKESIFADSFLTFVLEHCPILPNISGRNLLRMEIKNKKNYIKMKQHLSFSYNYRIFV